MSTYKQMATVTEQIACENPNESLWYALLQSMPRLLLGQSALDNMIAYAWFIIIFLYVFLYFLPKCFLNSVNGFRNARRIIISTFVIFVLLVFLIIVYFRTKSCASKRLKATYHVLGKKPSAPMYLSNAIQRVISKNPTLPIVQQYQPLVV